MAFEALLLFLAKMGLGLFLLVFLVRWLFVIPYLYFRYDRLIMKLKNELDNFRQEVRKKKGVSTAFMNREIEHKSREITEKLELLEIRRRLFLDRVNLFLSIISVNKK